MSNLMMAQDIPRTFPAKMLNQSDIGNPALAGKVSITDKGLDITAGGADIWGTRDEFHFSYQKLVGDFEMSIQVLSLSAANQYTKAGIMARVDSSDNSQHVYFQVFPDNSPRNKNNGGCEFQYRSVKGGEMKAIYPAKFDGIPEFPVNYPNTWIRLKRVGSDFTGFYSADGKTWKSYTTFNMEISKKVYLGFAVTSHDSNATATAEFSNISFSKK